MIAALKPVNGNILIRVKSEIEKMNGSIIIPEIAGKEKSNIAHVVAVDYTSVSSDISVGDEIMFNRHSGSVLFDKDDPKTEYRMIKQADILAIIDE